MQLKKFKEKIWKFNSFYMIKFKFFKKILSQIKDEVCQFKKNKLKVGLHYLFNVVIQLGTIINL